MLMCTLRCAHSADVAFSASRCIVVELAEQEKHLGIFFDTLIVCSVTGSSHAGLIVGAYAEGKGRKVIGIDASGKPEPTKAQVACVTFELCF